ncbi:uncharacterized protein F5Z01DRAFT_677578 [Emericellopsis atlantica]|uniref:Uncharacterized protein n=1 Tax=Emericellopsis atlantica TaxID=2614577 RepID=A0A9P7ZFK8_9HYPO|nr:uncharacterized protein F5Z01DRAFT_677578 [Emericellopsis atlantica]KAG9250757.1 hypothetical protein F5Z01DRAFT_677578 [Emericellopsis atlantica]
MVRLYGEHVCKCCLKPGEFGWVYRCTQDREDMLEFDAATGHQVADDELGRSFASQMSIRERSAAARRDRLSFLEELDSKQLSQYRPDQIVTILRQREEVHHAIARDVFRDQTDILSQILDSQSRVPRAQGRSKHPWVTDRETECQYMVCPACRPGCIDRAYLSLVGVSKGETPPTAAVGFGFHGNGGRPVVHPERLRMIGCRAVPLLHPRCSYDSSSSSAMSVLELLDQQLGQGRLLSASIGPATNGIPNGTHVDPQPTMQPEPAGHLKPSPGCENLGAFTKDPEHAESNDESSCARPPWTPSPSPSLYGKKSATELHKLGWAKEESISNGRSPMSIKTNQSIRCQLLTSIPSTNALQILAQSGSSSTDDSPPPLDECEYDVGLTLPFRERSFRKACETPLEQVTIGPAEDEKGEQLATTIVEDERGAFTPAPLQVGRGVAVLEESVELRVPDVITQI